MDTGVIAILCLLGVGVVMGLLALLIGYLTDPPRPAGWVANPYPGRSPYYDRGRTWTPLVLRALLVGVATTFCLLPGLMLLGFGASANTAGRRRSRS
ncbi:hypothetical protein [Gordonia sp. NPDC127522]|uniref:hypothetical protein n=1 Tax=Gordonia sp. NPDC127522 TaxID=3345390 RepID=UPI00362DDA94